MTTTAGPVVRRWERRIHRAEALASARPEAAEILRCYVALARWQAETAVALDAALPEPAERPAGPLPTEEYPLLRHDDLSPSALYRFTGGLATALDAGSPLLRELAARLRDEPELGRAVVAAYPAGQTTELATETDLPPAVLELAALATWQPLLELLAHRARPLLDLPNWYQPTCPFCGGTPVCSTLQSFGEPRGQRTVTCEQCLLEWPVHRLACPECAADREGAFSPLEAEQYPGIRVDACNRCRCYLKTADARKDGRTVALVDDMATLALDRWAESQGLHRLAPPLLR